MMSDASDIARAWTLESRLYTDPATLTEEREKIFAATWQVIGRADQAARPGDYFTFDLAGEPLHAELVRDREGVGEESPRALAARFAAAREEGARVLVGAPRGEGPSPALRMGRERLLEVDDGRVPALHRRRETTQVMGDRAVALVHVVPADDEEPRTGSEGFVERSGPATVAE